MAGSQGLIRYYIIIGVMFLGLSIYIFIFVGKYQSYTCVTIEKKFTPETAADDTNTNSNSTVDSTTTDNTTTDSTIEEASDTTSIF